MSDIEFDLLSNRSTSEISNEDFAPKCNFDDSDMLNEEGLERRNQYFQKCVKDNFKPKEYDTSDFNCIIQIKECDDNTIGNLNIFIGKKIERNDVIIEDNAKKPNQNKNKIFCIKKFIKYRHDYYIMAIKTDFLEYVQDKLNNLIDNIGLCKKFGQHFIHTPNRKLYGGNPKEKDNREFINKTVEEVFIDQGLPKDEKNGNDIEINETKNTKGTSRQEDNENIFNKIKNKICLANYENSQKYKEQSNAIEILTKFLKTKIRDVLDEYYDSEKFVKFCSCSKIKYYDEKFKKERNRNFSLLEKNNFVKLVEMPFYSNKKSQK